MPTPAYADGSMQFGSQAAVIGGQGYFLKNLKVKRSRKLLVRPTIDGEPDAKIHIRGLTEGSGTAQLGTSTQVAPAQDAVFALDSIGGGSPHNFITLDVEDVYEIAGETFCDFTFCEQLT